MFVCVAAAVALDVSQGGDGVSEATLLAAAKMEYKSGGANQSSGALEVSGSIPSPGGSVASTPRRDDKVNDDLHKSSASIASESVDELTSPASAVDAMQLTRRRFVHELQRYSYYLPPNMPLPEVAADASTLQKVATLRLVLELRVFAARDMADPLLEREEDVQDALTRDVTAVPRTALAAMLACVRRVVSLSSAISVCQRLEPVLTSGSRPRTPYAALVHGLLRPTVYDDVERADANTSAGDQRQATQPQAQQQAGNEAESDDASESADVSVVDTKQAAIRKAKKRLDRFVRDLLTESEAAAQLKFVKRFSKRLANGDRAKALLYGRENKPRVVLSAPMNDEFMHLALKQRRFDVFYAHALDLMAVVDGYPYHKKLIDLLRMSLAELDRFIESSFQAAALDSCRALCDLISQLVSVVDSAAAMPQALFERCVNALARGLDALRAAKLVDHDAITRALERARMDGVLPGAAGSDEGAAGVATAGSGADGTNDAAEDASESGSTSGARRSTPRRNRRRAHGKMQVAEAAAALELLLELERKQASK